MPTRSSGRIFLGTAALVLLLAVSSVIAAPPVDSSKTTVTPALKARATEPTYQIKVGLDGEVYPVFANYASLQRPDDRNWGTVDITIANSTPNALQNHIAVQILGWSDEEIQTVDVDAGAVRTFFFAPTFYSRLYNNREITAATALVRVRDSRGKLLFTRTVPVRLRSADDIFWGPKFEYAPFIASWVTPHDPMVEKVLGRAKEFAPGRRLPGYEEGRNAAQQELSTYVQARAIYRALQVTGVSYVKSSMTFGRNADVSERVRMPRESLRQISANCIDGAVMYASLFENLGMQPEIVLVPHHAYVGVRVAPESDQYLYIETALTGRASFYDAVRAAALGMKRRRALQEVRIPIAEAREVGIYPMPVAVQTALGNTQPSLSPAP
ncbi:MAG TPA: hypothetical protein VJ756_14470 [Terriglobales bacterium]|nr:hypothetical protein [Terriglobales bacterium]